jgi:hypothetical protein
MRIKPGVKLSGIRPEILVAIQVADELWREYCPDGVTITSVMDGHDHKPKSLHRKGLAVDLRIVMDIHPDDWRQVAKRLQERLGEEYDVVLETNPPHIHVEHDPV